MSDLKTPVLWAILVKRDSDRETIRAVRDWEPVPPTSSKPALTRQIDSGLRLRKNIRRIGPCGISTYPNDSRKFSIQEQVIDEQTEYVDQ